MTNMNTTIEFSCKLPNGRAISFGHEVMNGKIPSVAVGWNLDHDSLILRIRNDARTGGLEPGSFLASLARCS